MMIRSFCLTASLYAMAVCAGRVGPASLAAHQIILSLWSLSSYICDGFADVGTMLGAADVGADRSIATLSRRLLLMGVATGALCALLMWLLEDQIAAGMYLPPTYLCEARGPILSCLHEVAATVQLSVVTSVCPSPVHWLMLCTYLCSARTAVAFTHETSVHEQLSIIWPILVLMQPSNAAVFVYDGLMLALQAWSYIRNLMLTATVLLFAPALALCFGGVVFPHTLKHTLLAVWVAKCFLNLGRCVGSAWRVSWRGNEQAIVVVRAAAASPPAQTGAARAFV
jgi:Na+-driven multidrug efflux pump